jgi:hypothetical protein
VLRNLEGKRNPVSYFIGLRRLLLNLSLFFYWDIGISEVLLRKVKGFHRGILGSSVDKAQYFVGFWRGRCFKFIEKRRTLFLKFCFTKIVLFVASDLKTKAEAMLVEKEKNDGK